MNLRSLRRDMQTLIDLAAREIVEELPEALLDYARTGTRPDCDLHASYIDVSIAFDALADASVGADQEVYDAAVQGYRDALDRHEEILDGYGLPLPRGRELSRWHRLRPHTVQRALWESRARFKVVPSGRRSGKTELCKRQGVALACRPQRYADPKYIFCAPTYQQARRIFWDDVKRLVPPHAVVTIRESDLSITLVTGSEIIVVGLDKPERVEGIPVDWAGIDEFGNMKATAWTEHIRPALAERDGRAWIFGVPEGRNHYFRMAQTAQEQQGEQPDVWGYFSWPSSDILPAEEIEAARRELDGRTFDQEFCASFLDQSGRVYYAFDRQIHAAEPVRYSHRLPLHFAFDFNISPGVACIVQEIVYTGANSKVPRGDIVTAVVDEVWIPTDSNTPKVAGEILRRYGQHQAGTFVYADASGGSGHTSQVHGSDLDLLRIHLAALKPKFRVPHSNPAVRARINCVNSRLLNAAGEVHLLVDPSCRHTIEDLEGVTWTPGGDIDKKSSPELSHLSDSAGYLLHQLHPLVQHHTVVETIY